MSSTDTTDRDAAAQAPFKPGSLLKFLLPSALGVGLFLIPFPVGDTINTGMGLMADGLGALLAGALPAIAVAVVVLSVLATTWVKLARPGWAEKGVLDGIFHIGPVWFGMRILGAAFALMIFFQFGPEFVTAPSTGGVILNDLAPVLLTIFFFAALLLPLLLEFGLMEFVGNLVRKPFRFIFNLPGRSAIDASASWMGSAVVAVLITTQQYEKGLYNLREAAVIATNFSVVSIAFSLVVISFVDLSHLFVQFYFTVVVAGLIAAVIVSRLPPLSRKPDTYYEPVGRQLAEEPTEEMSLLGLLRYSLTQAVRRAEHAPGPRELVRNALFNLVEIYLALLPLMFAIGTVALILSEFTPLFTWLSFPMVPVLELLRIPEAEAAAPSTLVGFADMFLPAVLAANIESELTRFVIASLSLTQLIYMSEVGVLLLRSKLQFNLWQLGAIFLLRTAITLPIIAFMAHTFFF